MMNDDKNLLNETVTQPEGLPDKFWDADKGVVRVDALLKSYLELEKRMATSIPEPIDEDTRARFLKAAGVPAKPEDYKVSI